MDLATVLLLHKSSFLVGALCFLYVQWQSPQNKGLGLLAVGFFLLAVASTVAGMGEQKTLPLEIWTIVSFGSGVVGYAFFWIGMKRLSNRVLRRADWIALGIPAVLVVAAMATGLHLNNLVRACVFNANAVLFLGAAGIKILGDARKDRLPARYALSASLLTVTLLAMGIVAGMMGGTLKPIEIRYVFFLMILCHFAIALFTLVFVNERAEAELKHLADTDVLTGIRNRRWFFAQLPKTLHLGDGLVVIDIDHFKRVNDTLGHEAGDVALKAVAQEIARHLNPDAVLGRLGGEEFAVFLRNHTKPAVLAAAERLRASIEALVIPYAQGHIPLTISAGVCVSSGPGAVAADTAIVDADNALYTAKQRGRNQVVLSSDRFADVAPKAGSGKDMRKRRVRG